MAPAKPRPPDVRVGVEVPSEGVDAAGKRNGHLHMGESGARAGTSDSSRAARAAAAALQASSHGARWRAAAGGIRRHRKQHGGAELTIPITGYASTGTGNLRQAHGKRVGP